MRTFRLIICLLFFVGIQEGLYAAEEMPLPFRIIPQPQKVELLQGKGVGFGELNTLTLGVGVKRPVMGSILSQLTRPGGAAGRGKGTLTLRLDSTGATPVSAEGYVLTIANGNVEITSHGEAGLFYGCQTLEQLLEDSRDFKTSVPACKVTDSPALSYRAAHFDVKHHLDHMNYYYESINRLARYKINAVIFEFEDKLRYQRQPLVGAPQAISIDEMAALTRYARERHIEVSPLVQGLGHATFILKHQEYTHLRELQNNRWAFCPLHEGTYQILFDMYQDAIDATPGSKYLHVGGDEVGNIGLCPRCKPLADKEGMLGVNLYWLKKVCRFAEEKGRIPIFWDDMPLKESGVYESTHSVNIDSVEAAKIWETGEIKLGKVISDFPKNCIYMRWNYSLGRKPGNLMAIDWLKKNGLKVIVATAAQTSGVLFPYDGRGDDVIMNGIASIQSFNQVAAEKGIGGMLCTAWDDSSPHMETYWRGFIASAEFSWNPDARTLNEYDKAYLQREYGTGYTNYFKLYRNLREAAMFWETAFNENGRRKDAGNALFNLPGVAHWMPPKKEGVVGKTDFTDVLIELPDLKAPGSWSKKYAGRLGKAESIAREYLHTSKVLDGLCRNSKRNRYHWEVFSALNNFQVTAPHLLLALKQYDTADKALQESGTTRVMAALQEFDKAWAELQGVYSKTRFIAYPEGYVPDRYSHYASQREGLSWMVQVEGLLHQMVRDRLNIRAQ